MAFVEEDQSWVYDHTRHNENTLAKVRDSLISYGLTGSDPDNCIQHMQNKGILFREHAYRSSEAEEDP